MLLYRKWITNVNAKATI